MPSAAPFFFVIGLAMVAGAAWWRSAEHRRSADRLHRALRDPDPQLRAAAVRAVGSGGLSRHAWELLERCRTETDEQVLDALQETVMRNLWEPSDTEVLVALRLWAHKRAGAFAEATRDWDTPEELLTSAPIAVPEPEVMSEPEIMSEPEVEIDLRDLEVEAPRPSARAYAAEAEAMPLDAPVAPAVPLPSSFDPPAIPLPATAGGRAERQVVDVRARLLLRQAEQILGEEVHSLVLIDGTSTVSYDQYRAAS